MLGWDDFSQSYGPLTSSNLLKFCHQGYSVITGQFVLKFKEYMIDIDVQTTFSDAFFLLALWLVIC